MNLEELTKGHRIRNLTHAVIERGLKETATALGERYLSESLTYCYKVRRSYETVHPRPHLEGGDVLERLWLYTLARESHVLREWRVWIEKHKRTDNRNYTNDKEVRS